MRISSPKPQACLTNLLSANLSRQKQSNQAEYTLVLYAILPKPPLSNATRLLLGLEIVEQDGALLALLAPVADDDAGAVDDFAGVAFAVEHTCKGERLVTVCIWREW